MKKILVVDDERSVSDLIRSVLKGAGYDAVSAYSGSECLKKIGAVMPDLIILDMKMPEMDGIQTLEKIRQISRKVKILFLSAIKLDLNEITNLQDKYNISGYIFKPITGKDLLDVVKNAFV